MNWRWPIIGFLFPAALSVAPGFSPARTPLTASISSAIPQASSRPAPVCASCHEEAKSQPATSMAHGLETVEECTTFASYPLLTFKDSKYSYRVERRGNQGLYTVSDGHQSLTLPIRWVMGASFGLGQTYFLEKDGKLYESRVSYYRGLKRLDVTLGVEGIVPADLNEAAGRAISSEEKLKCFFCHATNATQGRKLTLDALKPGVQCEH